MPSSRLAGLGLLALATAACPNPRNPLGPPVGPEPPASGSGIAFGIGGPGTDLVRAVAADAGGGVVVAGEFTGTIDLDPSTATTALTSQGGTDLFLARYSSQGVLLWALRAGGAGNLGAGGVAVNAAGDILLGGSFEGTANFDPTLAIPGLASNGGRDAFVASYSASGALRWARGFGGPADEAVTGVALQANSTAYASGTFTGTLPVDPAGGIAVTAAGMRDGFLVSWASDGSTRWAIAVGGLEDDAATAVAATTAGVYLAGTFRGTADFAPGAATTALTSLGGTDAFLAQYSGAGQLAWLRGLQGADDVVIAGGGLAATAGGDLAAAGSFGGTADFDGTAGLASRTSTGLSDVFAVRYGATGNFLWAVTAGGAGADLAGGVGLSGSGEVAITGSFSGVARFDPGPAATALTALGSGGATDIFVARYGAGGAFRWAVGIGAPLAGSGFASGGEGLAIDAGGGVFVGGRFYGTADADPSSGITALSSLGGVDGFVARYTDAGALATRP